MVSTGKLLTRALLVTTAAGATAAALVACLDNYRVVGVREDANVDLDAGNFVIDKQDSGSGKEDASVVKPPDGGDGGVTATPSFCDTPPGARPMGVAVGDYLCADFESALFSKGWDNAPLPAAGSLDKTRDVSVSKPFALSATGSTPVRTEAILTWTPPVGRPIFTEVGASFQLNSVVAKGSSPTRSYIELVRLSATLEWVTFGIERQPTVLQPIPTVPTAYVEFGNSNGETVPFAVQEPLKLNNWNDIKFTWSANGTILLLINGNKAVIKQGYGTQSRTLSVRLGAKATGEVTGFETHRFDNVQLGVTR